MPAAEVAERLHWLPHYVGLVENDDFEALRSPAFAQGYIRAYGRLLGVDERALQQAFATLRDDSGAGRRRLLPRSGQGQGQAIGVAIGLATLFLLILALWWLRGNPPVDDPTVSGHVHMGPAAGHSTLVDAPVYPAVVGVQ